MLYLDTSALVKRYSSEKGSREVVSRFDRGERIFTSRLTFAELHSSLGRKFRAGELTAQGLHRLREEFHGDWLFGLNILDLDAGTMSALPGLVEEYELKAGDAVHLSAAFWLRDTIRLRNMGGSPVESVEFGVADKQLAKVAQMCGFQVFNPES